MKESNAHGTPIPSAARLDLLGYFGKPLPRRLCVAASKRPKSTKSERRPPEGTVVNLKKVRRLETEERLQVNHRKGCKKAAGMSASALVMSDWEVKRRVSATVLISEALRLVCRRGPKGKPRSGRLRGHFPGHARERERALSRKGAGDDCSPVK